MAASSVPASVAALVSGAASVGFSGSRSAVPPCVGAVLAALSPSAAVSVGCASGLDLAVRSALGSSPRLSVFHAASFSASSWSGRLVLRSVACVRSVASAPASSLFVVFPSAACPRGLAPSPSVSACFAGFGSGSWASAAFAAGLGVPLLVFSPVGVPSWGFSALGGGWWLLAPAPALF